MQILRRKLCDSLVSQKELLKLGKEKKINKMKELVKKTVKRLKLAIKIN